MKSIIILALFSLMSFDAASKVDVVYGKDNRQDIYEVTNSLHKKLAQSTAGLIHRGQFQRTSSVNHFDLRGTLSLEKAQNICPSEAFSQQPLAPICSGFLVGTDTIVTAGHCYTGFDTPENICKNFVWVFDYNLTSESDDPTKNIPLTSIYNCKRVVTAALNNDTDYAVIKLDRAVSGRRPLNFRTTGQIHSKTSLVVIGHPTGLPTKVTSGGRVTRNIDSTRFSTNLDTFHGNSGSAVFDAKTGLVEGILIQGKTDYVPSDKDDPKSCPVVNACDNYGNECTAEEEQLNPTSWGEVVLRIANIAPVIKYGINLK